MSEIESVAAKHSPAVVLLNFAALSSPVEVQALAQRLPEARIVVLAHRPTAAECTQMLAFGATGCLSKETEARDVVNAIHLASRGMHVLPRSAAAGGGVDRLGMEGTELTARESEVLELLQDGYTNSEIAETLVDRRRDGAHARAEHLPEAGRAVAAGARAAGAAGAGRGRRRAPAGYDRQLDGRRLGGARRAQQPAHVQELGHLHRVGGRALAQVVARRSRG